MNAVDTNVLVYALGADEPPKNRAALDLLRRLSPDDTVLVYQVAAEFGAVVSTIVARGRAAPAILDSMAVLRARFPTVLPTLNVLGLGLDIHRRHRVAYWDAMLLAACVEAGVDRLYSEDLPGRDEVLGVKVVNPFMGAGLP